MWSTKTIFTQLKGCWRSSQLRRQLEGCRYQKEAKDPGILYDMRVRRLNATTYGRWPIILSRPAAECTLTNKLCSSVAAQGTSTRYAWQQKAVAERKKGSRGSRG